MVAQISPRHPLPLNILGADFNLAGFDIVGLKGNYSNLNLRGSNRLTPFLEISALVPFYRLSVNDLNTFNEIGDLDFALKKSPLRPAHSDASTNSNAFSFGMTLEVPTGYPSKGLGSGHYEVAFFTSAMTTLGKLWFIAP